jgi:ABC-type transport system substrate-binding protein
LSTYFHSGSSQAWFPKSATLDADIDKGRSTLDLKKAAKYYVAAQRFIVKNLWVDPLVSSYSLVAARTRVGGYQIDGIGQPVYQSLYVQ